MPSVDQLDEVEALCAIYPTEFESITSDPLKYKLHLTPIANGTADENHVAVTIVCDIPEEYPEVIPNILVEIDKGLGKRHKDEITELINSKATENLGMPSIYVIAEAVREWLLDNNVAGQDGSMYAEMTRRIQQQEVEKRKRDDKQAANQAADSEKFGAEVVDPEEEERVRRRQAGTAVTLETFLKWRESFEAEQREERARALGLTGKGASIAEDKMTGKQLFLSGRGAGLIIDADSLVAYMEAEAGLADGLAVADLEEEGEGEEDLSDDDEAAEGVLAPAVSAVMAVNK